MDGWMGPCLEHCHSPHHGWGSITYCDPGYLQLWKGFPRTHCSFLPWPLGPDEKTRFILSHILTTDSNHHKDINLVTTPDALFEHCFSIITLSIFLLLLSYHHRFEEMEEPSRCFHHELRGSACRWRDRQAEWGWQRRWSLGILTTFLFHTYANGTTHWRGEPFHRASSSSEVRERWEECGSVYKSQEAAEGLQVHSCLLSKDLAPVDGGCQPNWRKISGRDG